MNRLAACLFVSAGATVAGLSAWTRLRSGPVVPATPPPVIIEGPARHVVTPIMAEASRGMVDRRAPAIESSDTDGRRQILRDLCRRGPVVLNFVKDGCPCSDAAQPFLNQLQAAYPGVTFLGVIDVGAAAAGGWGDEHGVCYPLLPDPDRRIIRDYEIENSAYVVLVDSRERILKHWPGYSSTMLRELGAALAGLVGTAEQPLDVADAPEILYSGCPFDL